MPKNSPGKRLDNKVEFGELGKQKNRPQAEEQTRSQRGPIIKMILYRIHFRGNHLGRGEEKGMEGNKSTFQCISL